MKRILLSTLTLVIACAAATAQYFSTTQGQVMIYKETDAKEGTENALKSTVVSVDKVDNGVITARVEDLQSDPGNPLIEIKTYRSYTYDPATDITKAIVMSDDDFKAFVMSMIRQSADAAGQHMSEMEYSDLEKNISSKGSLEFEIDPGMEAGTKLPKSSLRLSAGMVTMRANLWDGKMLGIESVTVPAGTYDCVKISYAMVMSTPNGNDKRNIIEWYAKDLGLVKSAETDKKGNVTSETVLLSVK